MTLERVISGGGSVAPLTVGVTEVIVVLATFAVAGPSAGVPSSSAPESDRMAWPWSKKGVNDISPVRRATDIVGEIVVMPLMPVDVRVRRYTFCVSSARR